MSTNIPATSALSSTDKNDFDDWLKKNLFRDLLFRFVLWTIFSLSAVCLAVDHYGVPPLDYLNALSRNLGPVIDFVGTLTLLLSVLAMMLKDLEATLLSPARVAATRGQLGGFVRRFAGDLSLWTLGALSSVLTALIFAIHRVELKHEDYAPVGTLVVLLLTIGGFIAFANVFVRRGGPTPLLVLFKDSAVLVVVYIVGLAILIGRMLF